MRTPFDYLSIWAALNYLRSTTLRLIHNLGGTMKEKRSHSVFGTSYLATSGVIAALYVVLTLPFAQFAFGPIQFRLAEIMTVLPIFSPAAIPGLTIGCFLSNLLNPDNLGPIDIIFGSLATLLAATWTRSIFAKGDWL